MPVKIERKSKFHKLVYSDRPHRFRNIVFFLLVVGLLGTGWYYRANIISTFTGQGLQTQLLALPDEDQEYLLNLSNGLAFFSEQEVSSSAAFQQRIIETLIVHANEFDPEDVESALAYVVDYYGFEEPIPEQIQFDLIDAAEKFVQSYPLVAAQDIPLSNESKEYLLDQNNGLAGFTEDEVADSLSFQQRLIETLIVHANEFDTNEVEGAMDYLYDYYVFDTPIPSDVDDNLKEAASRFVETFPLLDLPSDVVIEEPTNDSPGGSGNAGPPPDVDAFLQNVVSVVANHQSQGKNFRPDNRAKSIEELLEAFMEQL